jgi:hypothetical protein
MMDESLYKHTYTRVLFVFQILCKHCRVAMRIFLLYATRQAAGGGCVISTGIQLKYVFIPGDRKFVFRKSCEDHANTVRNLHSCDANIF